MARDENTCTAVPAIDASLRGNLAEKRDAKRPLAAMHEIMQSVFALADDIHNKLASIQPRLSEHQLEQVNEILVRSLCIEGAISGIAPAVSDNFFQDACSELWRRLALDSGVPLAWVTLVIRTLFVLCEKAELDSKLFLVHLWRIVAHPAEELCCGLGQAIMRASLESSSGKITAHSTESLGTVAGGNLKLLIEWVVFTLGRDGNLPPLSTTTNLGVGGQAETVIPSQSGMRLAIDIASQTIAMLKALDATHLGPGFGKVLQAWRWDIHLEVIRLLRDRRMEGVQRHLVVTIAGPLYQGWGDLSALEDLWHFISSANDQSVELHLALLCTLAEDFIHFLDLPARHAQGFWDLIHLGMSNKSDLARRRGLHVLQKVLALTDESVNDDESLTKCVKGESSSRSLQFSGSTGDGTPHLKGLISGDALVQWKDYARVMKVLEMETEMHLLDQVVPTVERLCAKLSEKSSETSCKKAHPMATEFRWIAIPLGLLITTGTIVRRRALISRIVMRHLGQQADNANNQKADNKENKASVLSKVDEAWVAQVLVPAVDRVGWHSSTSKASLQAFSRSVTEFFRCFVRTLSMPRMTIFLELLLRAIRERSIGSTGALFALLAALDLDGAKIPALGPHALFQLKEMLVTILPPLNQAKRILLLDGVIKILEAFTDYENLALFIYMGNGVCASRSGDGNIPGDESSPPALEIVMDILSAIPRDLITHRYLPQLARWVYNFRCMRDSTSVNQGSEEHVLWSVEFKGRVETYLRLGKRKTPQTDATDGKLEKQSTEGRKLCLLGLVLSEGFASKEKRGEVLADGLSSLVKVLRQCWKESYLAAETVEAALSLFSAWTKVSDADHETRLWRRRPLEASIEEVTNLVTARLKSIIDTAQRRHKSNGTLVSGGDAQILLRALEAAMNCARDISHNRTTRHMLGAVVDPVFHPEVLGLRETCVSLLTSSGLYPVAPAAHMLAVTSLEIVVRAQGYVPRLSADVGYQMGKDERRFIDRNFPLSRAEGIVRSLLLNNIEGRVTSLDKSLGHYRESAWADISKQHEQRKWACLSVLLLWVLGEAGTSGALGDAHFLSGDPPVFEALIEGIRASSREEMPMAIACFQTFFPWYMQSLSQDRRAAEFTRVFKLVWETITEAPRPQVCLVRDMVSAVLHPVHLAMPELYGTATSSDQQQVAASCIASALKYIVAFGVANRASVLRALVGRLTDLWRLSPGGLFHLVPEMLELLLFKERGQGIENVSNEGISCATEAPRLMLLLLVEKTIIPSAAKGDHVRHNFTDMHQEEQFKESRQILRSLIFGLMELHNSKEFRQAGITDQVIYGRKLRSWQALCILCGYLCVVPAHASTHVEDGDVSEIVEAVSAWFWSVHGRTALPAVRQHMEVFAVRMCQAHPNLFVPSAIEQLSDVRLPGQVLCSLLIVAGHLLVGRKRELRSAGKTACLSWMVGTHVMGRMIAQFICHSLLPEVPIGLKGTFLEKLFSFLDDNADMVAMRERQLESFRQTDCAIMCTVKGLLEAHGSGSNGEITPTHMCELLQETMDEIWIETQQDKIRALEEGRLWLQTMAEVEKGTWFEADEAISFPGVDGHIQQKIIPWDKLDLALDLSRSASLDQSTAAGRMRQPVVMCATLVDKTRLTSAAKTALLPMYGDTLEVPNLAGLARTCEIFAVSNLLVPDVRVMKTPSFSKISTGAEQWLPVGELREKQLLPWIRRYKKQGYTLVGIEQTSNSVCLTEVKFPRMCVLVLGREHSGLPLPVINEMDLCCQIPQQGILRSLNAHVSGSLVLWEYTRQMIETASY